MRRSFVHLLLMLCMGWQSLAYAGAGVLVARGGDELAHAMLHFEGEAHHHEGHDGEFHQDKSPASVKHAMHDACLFAPALLTTAIPSVQPVPAQPPADAQATAPPLPFLSGPERPPKTLT